MADEYAPLVSPKTRDARPARRCVTCCVVVTIALVALAHARGFQSLQLSWDDDDHGGESGAATGAGRALGPRCDDALDASSHAPAMTARETALMLKYLAGSHEGSAWGPGEALYLEWGSGGSTATFGTAARRTFTVEHAVEWCEQVREWPETRCMARANRWEMFCHDAGHALEAWGYPDGHGYSFDAEPAEEASKSSKSTKSSFHPGFHDAMRTYVQAPGRFGVAAYDVVLIDGRFRNACAFAILPYLRQDSVVFWHDWTREDLESLELDAKVRSSETPASPTHRTYHRAAGRLFELVETADTLAVFKVDPAVYDTMQSMA